MSAPNPMPGDLRVVQAREVLARVADKHGCGRDHPLRVPAIQDIAIAAMLEFAATIEAAARESAAWFPIAELTDEDGYVLGWAERADGCTTREWFIGLRYDIRTDALLNEWTGRWRVVTHWQRLSTPFATAIRESSL